MKQITVNISDDVYSDLRLEARENDTDVGILLVDGAKALVAQRREERKAAKTGENTKKAATKSTKSTTARKSAAKTPKSTPVDSTPATGTQSINDEEKFVETDGGIGSGGYDPDQDPLRVTADSDAS